MSKDGAFLYEQAVRRLREAAEQMERYVAHIQETAQKLQDWQKLPITGDPGELTRMLELGAGDWPTVKELELALQRWHKAKAAAKDAWHAR